MPSSTDTRRSERLLLGSLAATMGLQFLGATAILPILPLFLVHQDVSVGTVGIVMGAYFAAAVLAQYPSGWAADRWGHRPVIVAGLLLYGAASVAFVLVDAGGVYALLRALQGFGSGAVRVAALSMVGRCIAPERRGVGFAWLYSSELAGMAIGPVVGSLVPERHVDAMFIGTAVCSVLACLPMVFIRIADHESDSAPTDSVTVVDLLRRRGLQGAMLAGLAGGLCAGVYEACWSLLLQSKGASTFQIGLSFAAYAIPFIVVAPFSGRLVDRYDQRVLALAALALSATFLTVYPFLDSPLLLIALGAFEAAGFTVAYPAALSLLSRSVPAAVSGRAQSLFGVSEMSAIAVGASVAGALFAHAVWLPFVVASGAVLVVLLAAALIWRPVPGHSDGPSDPALNAVVLER
ncbi:MFS transporter [Mycobacterium sp. M26]|uniref:MFS transporter n=1 Tax=Mycobacterium sp. M26 TaxID=1762962 RepID=UPI000AAD1D9E|nr:MFS transporter [Mycobacterium sp. M26]